MKEFYSLKKEELLRTLNSSENGLSKLEVERRLKEKGKNIIKEKDKMNFLFILLSQFKSPLILILIFATIISFLMGERIDAIIILSIIGVSGFLSFYQEYKSDRAINALKKYISFRVKVIRDGKREEVDSSELIVGDIVLLNIGDIVPADLRIIESKDLYVDESIITGESYPIKKNSLEINEERMSINSQTNMLFMGSEISEGFCKAIVVATGNSTRLGKTAEILSAKVPPSDFQKGLNNFGRFLIKVLFLLTIFVFTINFIIGKEILDSFLFAIAIAVGVTPELLPVIMTISLARGAEKMVNKKVVVKKLISIENLGNMDVLCTDKTGTITENTVSLTNFFNIKSQKDIRLINFATICNSTVTHKHKIIGNPIDKAIIEYVNKNNIKILDYERLGDIEFDHKRRRMSSIVKIDRDILLICKGETLSILNICFKADANGKLENIEKYSKEIKRIYENLSRNGLRVISLGYKRIEKKSEYNFNDEKNLIFLGFLVFTDPPKRDVKDSLINLDRLGVKVKIVTGDNEIVTEEICRKVGFKIEGKVITGPELENINEKKFFKIIEKNNVFARITPEQKLKIVQSLRKKGHTTGFLGDGVNDSLAIKYADVGICVNTSVDVVKNNADIILLRKSLSVIADGILEGRKTFGNSTKYILNTISANFGNMLSLSISSIYFNFIPLLPKQILLTNFISDIPLLAISGDNVDEEYLKKPKKWDIKLVKNFMIFFGIISSIFDIITIAVVWFLISPGNPVMFRTVWFTESVLSEIIITFSIRTRKPFFKSRPSNLLIIASIVGIVLTLITIFSTMNNWFSFKELTIITLAIIIAILASYFLIVEISKRYFYLIIEKE
ncbi:MAG: magnesium-translocating P-type ATPase, partial [Candidatus Pacearchaeota archaeon]